MTENQKEFDAATKELSVTQTMYNKIKAWYESLPDPSANDQVIWLSMKDKLSKASKRVYTARQKVQVEQMSQRLSDSSGVELSEKVQSILHVESVKVLSKKELKIKAENEALKRDIITWIEHGSDNGIAIVAMIDSEVAAGKEIRPFGNLMSPEEWEQFKKDHPLPSVRESDMPLAADPDIDDPSLAMPAPVEHKHYTIDADGEEN